MLVSLIAALVAAVLYGVAAVMQAIAVRAASNKTAEDASGGVDPSLVVRLLGRAARTHGLAVVCATHDPVLIEAADTILPLQRRIDRVDLCLGNFGLCHFAHSILKPPSTLNTCPVT